MGAQNFKFLFLYLRKIGVCSSNLAFSDEIFLTRKKFPTIFRQPKIQRGHDATVRRDVPCATVWTFLKKTNNEIM